MKRFCQQNVEKRGTIVVVSTFASIYSKPEKRRGKEDKLEPEKKEEQKQNRIIPLGEKERKQIQNSHADVVM